MRFGVWTPLPHILRPEPRMEAAIRESGMRGVQNGPDKAFDFAVDMIRRAEDLGFESTLIAERWLGTDHPAWILTAALAALTRKIELMVAVHPGIIAPQAVAKFTASLDRISGGRAALNIVNGWFKQEFETFGTGHLTPDEDARYRRMEEFVRVIHGMWGDDKFDFHGEFYKVEGQTSPLKPVQRPNPPIYAASRNDAGKETIARFGDNWFADYVADYRVWEQNAENAAIAIADMKARAARYGRKLGFSMSCHVICSHSTDDAIEQANQLEAHGKTNRIAWIASKALGTGFVGTPDTIVDRIQRFAAAGVETMMLQFHPMIEGMETFAREIMPLLDKKQAA
jgi:FMNH2-dependent dimethyl sulfone monooxygenase